MGARDRRPTQALAPLRAQSARTQILPATLSALTRVVLEDPTKHMNLERLRAPWRKPRGARFEPRLGSSARSVCQPVKIHDWHLLRNPVHTPAMHDSPRIEAYWRAFAKERGLSNTPYTAFAFGDGSELADELLELVVRGDKRATACLVQAYIEPLAAPGDYAIVLDGSGAPCCVLMTREVVVKPFAEADDAFAWDEGEGDRSLVFWRDVHNTFFRGQAETAGIEFGPTSEVVLERFELVWPACPARIRREAERDADAVREVTVAAFSASPMGHHGEAEIIDALRATADQDCVSLVAECEGEVVGHILFSPVVIDETRGMGLGPMAVAPHYQRQRVGIELIRAGLAQLRSAGHPWVVVLGHPAYYQRFGFRPAAARGIACEYQGVPDEAFMVLSLDSTVALPRGQARYLPAFRNAM